MRNFSISFCIYFPLPFYLAGETLLPFKISLSIYFLAAIVKSSCYFRYFFCLSNSSDISLICLFFASISYLSLSINLVLLSCEFCSIPSCKEIFSCIYLFKLVSFLFSSDKTLFAFSRSFTLSFSWRMANRFGSSVLSFLVLSSIDVVEWNFPRLVEPLGV